MLCHTQWPLGPGRCTVTPQSHQAGEAAVPRSHLATGEAGNCGPELVGLCPDTDHQGVVTTEERIETRADQQSATLCNLKEMAVLYDPGQAPPPAWASLLGSLKVMENGSNARMSTTRPSMGLPQGLPPAFLPGPRLLPSPSSSSSSASDIGLPTTFSIPLVTK